MTHANLTLIVEQHEKWLRNESDGVRANLRNANLSFADLAGANLSDADLSGADLSFADLAGANLSDAIIIDAYLHGCNLTNADLTGADLRNANLSFVDLRGANLRGADLRRANLRATDLRGVDLSGTNLTRAIKVPMHCKWSHGITAGQIHIGCDRMSIDEWDKFFASDSEFETPRGTPEFRQIQAVYNGYKAYLTTLNE